jgi:hypothetical protein
MYQPVDRMKAVAFFLGKTKHAWRLSSFFLGMEVLDTAQLLCGYAAYGFWWRYLWAVVIHEVLNTEDPNTGRSLSLLQKFACTPPPQCEHMISHQPYYWAGGLPELSIVDGGCANSLHHPSTSAGCHHARMFTNHKSWVGWWAR